MDSETFRRGLGEVFADFRVGFAVTKPLLEQRVLIRRKVAEDVVAARF